MKSLLNQEIRNQLKEVLQMMKKPVTMVLFTKKEPCQTCEETKQLLTEMTEVTPLVKLVVKDFDLDLEDRAFYDIALTPSFVILDDELKSTIKAIDKPVNIKVFVTLSCPHCPGAVQTAHRLAMLNPNIKGEMIEAQTFYELSNKYQVSGVPKIVINDKYELLGNQPVENFLKEIEKL